MSFGIDLIRGERKSSIPEIQKKDEVQEPIHQAQNTYQY